MPFSKDSMVVTADQRQLLSEWLHAHASPQQAAKRFGIILLDEQGWSNRWIAAELRLNRHICRL